MEIKTSCFLKVNNCGNEYLGELYYNKLKGIIFFEIHIPNTGIPLSFLEIPLEIDFVTGNIITGAKLTLINCKRFRTDSVVGEKDVFGYKAEFLVNGYCFESMDELVFSQISFRLSNFLEWGGISKYELKFNEGYEFQLVSNDLGEISMFSDEHIKIRYRLRRGSLSLETMKEELIFKQNPFLIIESIENQPIRFFIEKLKVIKQLIELAIGNKIDLLEIKAEKKQITRKIKEFEIPIEFEIYHASPQQELYTSLDKFNFLFGMQELINNANLSDWFQKYVLFEPILELYIEDLTNKELSLNRKFLNIIQALETYHSRILCNGSLATYRMRVEKILSNCSVQDKKKQEELLLADCRSKITLKARIYDLLLADFKIYFDTGSLSHEDFPQKIADTRNYFTHYDPDKYKKALLDTDLADAYIILKTILEYYLMLEAGFTSQFSVEKIKEKEEKYVLSREIRNADRSKM